MKSHIHHIDTPQNERNQLIETEELVRLFDGALSRHGIKNVDFIPEGFEFKYKGKTVEVHLKIRK